MPDANVMFTGHIVEYQSARHCGVGHFNDWPATRETIPRFGLDAIAPGRGDAITGRDKVIAATHSTRAFVLSTFRQAARVASRSGSLKQAWDAARQGNDTNAIADLKGVRRLRQGGTALDVINAIYVCLRQHGAWRLSIAVGCWPGLQGGADV